MYNQNSGYGEGIKNLVSQIIPTFGRIFVVFDPDDTDEQNYQAIQDIMKTDPEGQIRFFGTNAADGTTPLEQAYAAVESNNNDVILLDANSTHLLTTTLNVSKNRVHFIGMDGGARATQQGAKIQNTGNPAEAALIKVTGVRCSFRNIKFIQASTNAAAINVVQAAGEGNLYEDCSFIFGVADNLDLTTATELLCGEDAGTFRRCSFGTDVLITSAARAVVTLDAVSGGNADGAKSNRFIDCEYIVASSSNGALLLKLADTAGAKFLNHFVRPQFIAVLNQTGSAAAITNAVASASGYVEGSITLYLPASFNCTNLCAGVTANVVTYAPATAAAGGEGGTPS